MSEISASYQPNKIKRKGYTSWIDESNLFCTTSSTTLDTVRGQNLMDAFDVDWSAYEIDGLAASANAIISKLNEHLKQIDGETSSWLFEGEPTTTNKPANEWTGTDENGATFDYRQRHEGDTYTNIENAILLDSSMWEQGGIVWNADASASGRDQASDYFVRTKYINVEGCSQLLKLESDYSYAIFYYDSNKTCLKVDEVTAKGLAIPTHLQILKTVSNQNVVYFRLRLGYKKEGTKYLKFNVGNAVDAKAMINPTAGQSWRWCNVDDEYGTGWHWRKIADSDAVKALTIANGVREDFDNLEIGGVNLLPNTRTGVGFTFQLLSTGCSGEFDSTNKWFKFTCPQNAVTTSLADTILLKSPTVLLTPGTYTVSCLYRCTLPLNRMQVWCLPVTSEGSYDNAGFVFTVTSSNPVTYFKKYSATFTISEDLRDVYGWIIRIDLDHRGSHSNSQELYVKDIKLEKGHKATDWTPTLYEITPDLSGYLPLTGGTMTGAIDFDWNGSDIHNMLTWRGQSVLLLDGTDLTKLYLGAAAQLPLTVHELTTNGNILPSTSAPPIGLTGALVPELPSPTYISLGSDDKYFDKVYAREFKGLADNALKLYTHGTGFQWQSTPYAITKGNASKPVYFLDGVPVECNSIPTVNDGTLTLKIADTGRVTHSANASTNSEFNVPEASADAHGVIKVSSKNTTAVTVNAESTTARRYYPVELNSDGKAIVNVPWTDTDSKVTQSVSTSGGLYPLLCKYNTTNDTTTNSVNFVSEVTVNPSTGAVNATAFYETSDIRKKDIKSDLSLDKCYDLIDKCQTVIYSLKDQTKELIGMIAQEIEEFFPEAVATDEEGFKSLAYDRLVVICFKVLKDVIKRLEKLENE